MKLVLTLWIFLSLACSPRESREIQLLTEAKPGLVRLDLDTVHGWIYPPHLPQPTATVPVYGEIRDSKLVKLAFVSQQSGMVLLGYAPSR
jgi:hypothetical protein